MVRPEEQKKEGKEKKREGASWMVGWMLGQANQ